MQWLFNIPLKYKFWLVNSVSLFITLALVLSAMLIHTQAIQRHDADNASARLGTLASVVRELPREQVLASLRGDWFAVDSRTGVATGSAAMEIRSDLLSAAAQGAPTNPHVFLHQPDLISLEPGYWVATQAVTEHGLILGVRVKTKTLALTFLEQSPLYAGIVCVLMLILMVVSQLLITFISRHIIRLKDVMLHVERTSDLTLRVAIEGKDEIGAMAGAFNALQDSYQRAVRAIRESSVELDQEVKTLRQAAEETQHQMDRQQLETDQVVTAMQQMSGAAQEVARNASHTLDVSESAAERALAGNACVQQTRTAILQLSEEILASSRLIEQLNENSQRIESATSQIQTISEQTNLLALNAAIEAARAGEVGRGFAVVADEVRNLARHAHEASGAINQVVDSIRKVADEVTWTMEASRAMANQCVERAEDAAVVLQDINRVVEQIKDNNLMVATAAEEQSQASETISAGLRVIREDTQRTAANAAAVSACGAGIDQQARLLNQLVQSMKV
jgi:methyl-accepting chemotaxis protein